MVVIQYLYRATVCTFLNDEKVLEKMQERARNRIDVSKGELDSWSGSIEALQRLLKKVVEKNREMLRSFIILEAKLQDLRSDCFIFGKNRKKEGTLFIIEMKQWSGKFVSLPDNEDDIRAGYVMTKFPDFPKQRHPSLQASDYRWRPNMIPAFKDNYIKRVSVAYCYKCEYKSQTYNALYDNGYKDYRTDCKLYTEHSLGRLVNAIEFNVGCGDGYDVFNDFINYDE